MDITKLSEQEIKDLQTALEKALVGIQQDKIKAVKTAEVRDLFNQLAIILKDVPDPVLNEDYDDYYQACSIPVDFKYGTSTLSSIKVVVTGVLKALDKDSGYDIERMARSYYSSFCNG